MAIDDEYRIERLLRGITERFPQERVIVRVADKQDLLAGKILDRPRLRYRAVDPNDQGDVGTERRRDMLGQERPQRKLSIGQQYGMRRSIGQLQPRVGPDGHLLAGKPRR